MPHECDRLIDREAVASLARDIGLGDLAFAAKQFSADAQASADALSKAWLDGDDLQVRRMAHRLRGLAVQYGAIELLRTLDRLREATSPQQSEPLMQLLEQVPASIRCLWLTIDDLQAHAQVTRL